jgi:hypothetical protein
MGIETRKGRLYYYKKRREGDRVVSQYVGGGDVIPMAERLAALEHERKQEQRAIVELQQKDADRINAIVDKHSAMVDSAVKAQLLALGYHKHNRQWRRKRG